MQRNTSSFALGIGTIIIKFSEIDFLTLIMKKNITGKPVSKSWVKTELKERLEKIIVELDKKGEDYSGIAHSFKLALHLINVRNTVAHGSFLVLPAINLEVESELGIGGIRSKTPPLSLKQIQDYAKFLSDLSDQISEQISIIEMKKAVISIAR